MQNEYTLDPEDLQKAAVAEEQERLVAENEWYRTRTAQLRALVSRLEAELALAQPKDTTVGEGIEPTS